MRSGPIGMFPTIEKVIENATIQAAITHNTPDGIKAAIAAALIPITLLSARFNRRIWEFLEKHVPGEWSIPGRRVSTKGWSVLSSYYCVMLHDSMSKLLQDALPFPEMSIQ